MIKAARCRYCHTLFTPSACHPQQKVCFSESCRTQRKRNDHRNRYHSDPDYRQQCLESVKKWRGRNPDYSRQYRKNHPEYVLANCQAQKRRDQLRRLQNLAKNNLALALSSPPVEVWLFGEGLEHLAKNNLAVSQVAILQSVATVGAPSFPSCKKQLSGMGGGPGV